jgi:hypothetical protein
MVILQPKKDSKKTEGIRRSAVNDICGKALNLEKSAIAECVHI